MRPFLMYITLKENISVQNQLKDVLDQYQYLLHQLQTVYFTNFKEYKFQIFDDVPI